MKVNTNLWNKIRYSIYTPFYDLIAAPLYKSRKKSIELLSPNSEDKLLILGAGTGLDLYYLRHCRNITAIDITSSMLGILKMRAKQIKMDVTAITMDGQKLEFPDNSFDCIILHLIIAVIPDPIKCIKEVERVLKPGGKVVIFDKFLSDEANLSFIRKIVNSFTNFMFSNITRKSKDIIHATSLQKVEDISALLGGAFRIIKLVKN